MLITRDDIQRIGDEDTLMHFLEEKLNLSIPEDLGLEDITTKFSNFALGLSGVVANQVLDCQEPSVSPGKSSGIILIRFNSESGYAEVLRATAEGLDRQGRNPADLRFICMNESFQPFAFAYFSDFKSENWQNAVLNILAWTQENTHIYINSEHELPTEFFANQLSDEFKDESDIFDEAPLDNFNNIPTRQTVEPTLPEALLAKLKNTGTLLGRNEDIYRGISLGRKNVFVIDQSTRERLLTTDPNGANIIESFPDKPEKWRWKSRNIIYIPSSKNRQWPWSGITNESEAERAFEMTYPAISTHMRYNKNSLKEAKIQVEFYWEFPPRNIYDKLKQPKIIFDATDTSMKAAYDPFCKFLYAATLFIPTTDLSLLAILNSKLFDWFANKQYRSPNPMIQALAFTKKNMVKTPIADRTNKQKKDLSHLVQQILDAPNSPEVPVLEEKINMLVYDLYELTPSEIALIEEESNHQKFYQ